MTLPFPRRGKGSGDEGNASTPFRCEKQRNSVQRPSVLITTFTYRNQHTINSMKGKLLAIFGFVLIVTGFITFLFFDKYSGRQIFNPWIWYIAGVLAMIIGYFLIKIGISNNTKKQKQELAYDLNIFKSTAQKIKVNLNECKILKNNYQVSIDTGLENHGYQALDALYDSSRLQKHNTVNQSIIVFETNVNGRNKKYLSEVIPKDAITLSFLLDKQKETFLYIDRDDYENYYFDLEFLNT